MLHAVDIAMLSVMGLTLLILFLGVILSRRKQLNSNEDDITKLGRKLRNRWLGSSIAFLVVYYWCILISILSTVIVLYLGCFEDTAQDNIKGRLIIYSAFSLFTTICPYVVNFLKLSKKYRTAFCEIEKQLLSSSDLGKAVIEGERIISDAFEE